MLGDLRVLDAGDELLLDCERVALQELFNMIRRFKLGRDVELHKRTLECGAAVADRPARARAWPARRTCPRPSTRTAPAEIGGAAVRLIATDLGVDVLCDAADAEPRRRRADRRGRRARRREDAAEVRRVETGRPRYGVDLDDTVIPQEAGLNERAVSFEKGCYVGQETVARLYFRGKPNRHLRGLRLSGAGRAPAPTLRLGEREVGRLGTVVDSPRTARSRSRSCAARRRPATSLAVGDGGVRAEVVDLPVLRRKLRRRTSPEEGHMAAHVLVVATVTAASDDLLAAVTRARAQGLACRPTSCS